MRHLRHLLLTFAALLFVVAAGHAQELKKKDKDDKKPLPAIEITEIAGKSFKEWVKELDSPDPAKREIALKTLPNFHPERAYEVLPAIFKQLEKKNADLSVRVNGTQVLATIFGYKQMQMQMPEKINKTELDKLKKNAEEAVGILRTGIKHGQLILKIRSMQALPSIGPASRKAMGEVVEAIGDPASWETRQVALETLAALLMFEPEKGLDQQHLNAMKVLGVKDLGAKAADGALDDNSYLVRYAALRTLVVIWYTGPVQSPKDQWKPHILAKINKVLDNENKKAEPDPSVIIQAHLSVIYVRPNAMKAAIAIDPVITKNHLKPIVEMLQQSDPTAKLNALEAIGGIGAPAKAAALSTVKVLMGDPEIHFATMAIGLLFNLEAFEELPELHRWNKELAKKVADAKPELEGLGKLEREAVQKLTEIEKEIAEKPSAAKPELDRLSKLKEEAAKKLRKLHNRQSQKLAEDYARDLVLKTAVEDVISKLEWLQKERIKKAAEK